MLVDCRRGDPPIPIDCRADFVASVAREDDRFGYWREELGEVIGEGVVEEGAGDPSASETVAGVGG